MLYTLFTYCQSLQSYKTSQGSNWFYASFHHIREGSGLIQRLNYWYAQCIWHCSLLNICSETGSLHSAFVTTGHTSLFTLKPAFWLYNTNPLALSSKPQLGSGSGIQILPSCSAPSTQRAWSGDFSMVGRSRNSVKTTPAIHMKTYAFLYSDRFWGSPTTGVWGFCQEL